ncbi:MAG: AAA family ATPase [Anaerolineales bacterium]
MITNIRLTNFKGHTDTSIDLGTITVLAGKNGAGKTSVLQALNYFSQLQAKKCAEVFRVGTENSPENLIKRGAQSARMFVNGTAERGRWSATVNIWSSKAELDYSSDKVPTTEEDIEWPLPSSVSIQEAIPHTAYLKLTAENLAQPSMPKDISPRVEYDGYGLASAIAYLQNAEPDSFDKLLESVKEVLPFVQRIRVKKKKIQTTEQKTITVDGRSSALPLQRVEIADELYLDLKSAESLPAHALSEGTLLTLGLLTVLVSPACPNLLLLDDIEQGLHPKAQRDVLKVIRKLTESRPSLQIVMATHSPYVIDEMAASDVWLLNADSEETIHAMQLSSHPDAEQALQMLSTGEFWGAVGEEWVTGKQ